MIGNLRALLLMLRPAWVSVMSALVGMGVVYVVLAVAVDGGGLGARVVGAVVLLVCMVPAMALIMHGQVLAMGYRPTTGEEHDRLRVALLTHLSASPPADGILRVQRCKKTSRMPDLRHPWRVLPWQWEPAVYLFAELPSAGMQGVNVARRAKAVTLVVESADLPARELVFIRDVDGAIAVHADLPARLAPSERSR